MKGSDKAEIVITSSSNSSSSTIINSNNSFHTQQQSIINETLKHVSLFSCGEELSKDGTVKGII